VGALAVESGDFDIADQGRRRVLVLAAKVDPELLAYQAFRTVGTYQIPDPHHFRAGIGLLHGGENAIAVVMKAGKRRAGVHL
jgi:hypothetical protein